MKNHNLRTVLVLFMIGLLGASLFQSTTGTLLPYNTQSDTFITINDARTVATSKLTTDHTSGYTIKEAFSLPLMYVFFLAPQGYIVVPDDTCLPPIIAYSYTNDFGEINNDNLLLNLLQADLSSRVTYKTYISEDLLATRQDQWNTLLLQIPQIESLGTTTIGPLLETTWSQGAPYNNFCPIDRSSGDRSVAGCPAVAMAQILNYHQTTQQVQFNDSDDYRHAYAGNNYWIDNDAETYEFPTFPELNTYLTTLESHYQNGIAPTDDDKAALTFACGVAATQVYNPGGSGTFGVNQAYQAYQRFSFDDISLLDDDDTDAYEHVQANIQDGLPVHIAVVTEGWTAGHNMVVDGYNTDGSYHINFGWGGSYDGWYMLPEELPYELTVLEGVIVDIMPSLQGTGLEGHGVLSWADVKPGSELTGSFTISSTGEPGSTIDWEIATWPDWGTWAFTPSSGENLTPEEGERIIEVTIVAPETKKESFAGSVKIINSDDSSDSCLIHVSLVTPKHQPFTPFVLRFLDNHPRLSTLFQHIFGS